MEDQYETEPLSVYTDSKEQESEFKDGRGVEYE